jgi:hypothetical protein
MNALRQLWPQAVQLFRLLISINVGVGLGSRLSETGLALQWSSPRLFS